MRSQHGALVNAERSHHAHEPHAIPRRSRRITFFRLSESRAIQETQEMMDYNLAGLALIAFLVLFLPCTGLIHRRARARAARAQQQADSRELRELLHAEAYRVLDEERNSEANQTR
jgi:flagellar biosynthesis/type III secretory pathway M-ring protein FliF/YscJ